MPSFIFNPRTSKKKKVKWRYLNDYTAYLTQTFQAANTLAMETAIGNNS